MYLAVSFVCESKRWWFLLGIFLNVLFQYVSTAAECCYQSAELERASGSFFGFHVLIWKQNCLWEASLVNFGCTYASKFLFPDAAVKNLCYPGLLPMGGGRKHQISYPQICILNLIIMTVLKLPVPSTSSL